MTYDELRALPRPALVATRGLTKGMRRVAVVLGDSRVPLKVRISVWRHASRRWTNPHAVFVAELEGAAPGSWPATRAAARARAAGDRP